MEQCKTFGLTDYLDEITHLKNLDCALFNVSQKTICFVREKRHLYFRVNSEKEPFYHLPLLSSHDDFQNLMLLLSGLVGLSGNSNEKVKDCYLWRFYTNNEKENEINPGDYFYFNPTDSMFSLFNFIDNKMKFKFQLRFAKSEDDISQFANFLGTLHNLKSRKVETNKNDGVLCYRFV